MEAVESLGLSLVTSRKRCANHCSIIPSCLLVVRTSRGGLGYATPRHRHRRQRPSTSRRPLSSLASTCTAPAIVASISWMGIAAPYSGTGDISPTRHPLIGGPRDDAAGDDEVVDEGRGAVDWMANILDRSLLSRYINKLRAKQ